MANFSQDGIQFTATAGTALPGKYGNGNNGDFLNAGRDGVEPFVNAVEIDWNGATPGIGEPTDTCITTTGELLKVA